MRSRRQAGFTLLEVGLAVTVGVVILGATVIAYKVLREQSGDAGMRQKTQDLQAMVEEMVSATHTLPSNELLWSAWRQRRPADFDKSPWAGPVIDPAGTASNSISIATIVPGSVLAAGTAPDYSALPDGNFQGGLYFYRINPNADGTPGQAQFWDMAREGLVPGTYYAIGGNKVVRGGGFRHFPVVSGR